MTEEQKQIVLDKCATVEIRKDAELLFDVLEQTGIKYGPGELDLSAKVRSLDFEKYISAEYAHTFKEYLLDKFDGIVFKYDIHIPFMGWAFNVEPLSEKDIYWSVNSVCGTAVLDSLKEQRENVRNLISSEFGFQLGFSDYADFHKCLGDVLRATVKNYSYPCLTEKNGIDYYLDWSTGILDGLSSLGIHESSIRYAKGRKSKSESVTPKMFYKTLLGENFIELLNGYKDDALRTRPAIAPLYISMLEAIS